MIKREYFVKRQDGKKSAPVALSVLRYEPDGEPRFLVQIVHGISERKERYFPLLESIADAGGIAVIHDLRGHGNTVRSADELGIWDDFGYHYEHLCDDIDAVFLSSQEFSEDGAPIEDGVLLENCDPRTRETIDVECPRYLLGFSMGALIAANYTARRPETLAGVILAGLPHHEPCASLGLGGLHLLSLLGGDNWKPGWLNRAAFHRYNRKFKPEPGYDGQFLWLSNDISNRMAFLFDPVCNHPKSIGAFIRLVRLARDTYRPASWDVPRRDLPILVTAGELDPVAGGDREVLYGVKFLGDMGFTDIETTMYRGMRHEIYHDIGRETPICDLISFCERHLDAENARLEKIRGEYRSIFETGVPAKEESTAEEIPEETPSEAPVENVPEEAPVE